MRASAIMPLKPATSRLGVSGTRRYRIVVGLAMLFCAVVGGGAPALAAWPEYGPGLPVCTAPDGQYNPVLLSDGVGGAIVAWDDHRQYVSKIYAQRFSAQGTLLWATDGILAQQRSEWLYLEQMVSDGSGGAILVWHIGRDWSEYDLYVQRVAADGTVLWPAEGVPVCLAYDTSYNPGATSDGAGGVIMAWQDDRSSEVEDLYAQRVSADGVPLWITDGIPICTAPGEQGPPHLVSDGAGGAIMAWTDDRGTDLDIFAQRVRDDGAVMWGAEGKAVCWAELDQHYCRSTSNGSGGAIIAWVDEGTDPAGNDSVRAQQISHQGDLVWAPEGVVLCSGGVDVLSLEMVPDGSGGVIVAWCDYDGARVTLQRLNAAGECPWGPSGVKVADHYCWIELVPDGAGGAIVVWRQTYSGSPIWAQRVDQAGNICWDPEGVGISYGSDFTSHTALADGLGGVFVAWNADRNADTEEDIYAQRLYADGTLGGENRLTPTLTPPRTPLRTKTPSPTVTPSVSVTMTASWTPYTTPTPTISPTPSWTKTTIPTQTRTPSTDIMVHLQMPSHRFSAGDLCALDLSLDNPGSAKSADLYVLLEAQGVYWCYPSWRPLEADLDHLALYVLPGEVLLELSPQFTMPAVPPAGPLYFHAGLLEAGGSGLEDLTSTVDSWEFWIE